MAETHDTPTSGRLAFTSDSRLVPRITILDMRGDGPSPSHGRPELPLPLSAGPWTASRRTQ